LSIECKRDPEPGVYALGSSGQLTPLGLATLAALSPDGRVAFGRYNLSPRGDNPSALVRLVDVATGRVLSTLDLSRAARKPGLGGLRVGSLASAAWYENEIVGTFAGEANALVFLRVQRNRLTLEQTLRIRTTTLPNRWGLSFGAPFFTDRDEEHVVVPVRAGLSNNGQNTAVLACDRRTRHCIRGQAFPGREWFSVVSNPSRPAG
jgi:hypothetical protein